MNNIKQILKYICKDILKVLTNVIGLILGLCIASWLLTGFGFIIVWAIYADHGSTYGKPALIINIIICVILLSFKYFNKILKNKNGH